LTVKADEEKGRTLNPQRAGGEEGELWMPNTGTRSRLGSERKKTEEEDKIDIRRLHHNWKGRERTHKSIYREGRGSKRRREKKKVKKYLPRPADNGKKTKKKQNKKRDI